MATPVIELEELLSAAVSLFRLSFGAEPTHCGIGPGRVNLIGEHTDYNDGFVLPMALPLVTLVVGGANGGEASVAVTTCEGADLPRRAEFPANGGQPDKTRTPRWAEYVRGVVANFKEAPPPAFDCVVVSSVPAGSGLSSSAALEVAVFSFLEALTAAAPAAPADKALACQRAEHDFALVPCGIMDQFISTLARPGHAMLLDCRSLGWQLVPLSQPDVCLVITESGVRHELAGGEYARRRAQCLHACQLLGVGSLRDATPQHLQGLSEEGEDGVALRRAKHVIGEIERTARAATLLAEGDVVGFGSLMTQSHCSLRDLYQVSCVELDQLVDLSLSVPGVLGSRMTGGGFGGCTVTLVRTSAVAALIARVSAGFGSAAKFHIASPSEGARSFKLPLPSL